MWIIWAMLIALIPLMGLMLYGWWHNRQVDKYEEWQKQAQGSVRSASAVPQ